MLPYIEILGKSYPMYGLCIAFGILAASVFMLYDCQKNNVKWENAVIIGLVGVFAGFLGAKLLYILVSYDLSEIADMIKDRDFESISDSGFVFYGGLIAGIAGTFICSKVMNLKLSDHENVLVKVIPFVHSFGRIGCFFAGCCYGRPTSSPIHVIFTEPLSDAPVNVPLIPVQLFEAGFNLILFFVLCFLDRKFKSRLLLPVYVIAYAAERFIIEYFRYDEIRGIYFGLSTSQWISIAMCVFGILLLSFRLKKRVPQNV